MNNDCYILGTSGFSAEVTQYIEDNKMSNKNSLNIKGYFDINNNDYEKYGYKYPYLGSEKEYEFTNKVNFVIPIADNKIRKSLHLLFKSLGHRFPNVIHHSCFVSNQAKICESSILCPFVAITSNAIIGSNFQANIYSYIAHDCIIGDNVTFAPSVKCNGNVIIEDDVYIGTGVVIHQGKPNRPLKIGKGAVIAAGSVVTRSIPEGMTVFGNPAIEFTKENIKRRR